MNRRQQVAINAKLQKIFARNDKDEFLSFPPPGSSAHEYAPEDLDILSSTKEKSNIESAAALEKLCEFAKLVNQAPRGPVFTDSDDEPLWAVYGNTLNNAETTMDTLTPEEQEAYDEAVDFLFVKQEGFISGNSEIYNIYNDYRDRYFDTLERNGDLSVLTAEWEARGARTKVEKYLDTIKQLTMKYPSMYIAKERNNWDENVVLMTTLQTGMRFAPTYMFPKEVYNQNWNLQTLNKDEIDQLVKEATVGSEEYVVEDEGRETVKITFECRSVKVDRPWFNRSVLDSRNWRFPPSLGLQPIACEGDDLSVGLFPAYVASLVLVRNIVVEEEITTTKTVPTQQQESKPSQLKRPPLNAGTRPMRMSDTESRKNVLNRQTANPKPTIKSSELKPSSDITTETVTTKTEKVTNVGTAGNMSIMVFICKKIASPCPNPDTKANWLGGQDMPKLIITQTDGGTLEAHIDGKKVGSNYYSVGQEIVFTAAPKAGHVLDSWLINSKKVDSNGNKLVREIPAEGLTVSVIWKRSKVSAVSNISLSKDGKTLLKCSIDESSIDMNDYAEFNQVTSIGPSAFENLEKLHQIRISSQVKSIEDRAFAECVNLQQVTLPASVLNIASSAFVRKDSVRGPLIVVEEGNESYAAFNGLLVGREHVGKVRMATCPQCSSTFFVPADAGSLPTCPRCSVELVSQRDEEIFLPDYYIPFGINEVEARQKLQKYLKKRNFILADFVKEVEKTFALRQVYVPYWEYDITADTDYVAKIKQVSTETVKNPDGTTAQKQNVTYKEKNGHTFHDYLNVAMPATRLMDADSATDLSKHVRMQPDAKWWNESAAFELYKLEPRQALDKFEDYIKAKLKVDVGNEVKETAESITTTTNFDKLKQRLLFRPLWVGSIEFQGKRYPITANGITGAIEQPTDYAIDKKKRNRFIAIIVGAIVLVGLVIWLLVYLFG